jgi:hypothetical protein
MCAWKTSPHWDAETRLEISGNVTMSRIRLVIVIPSLILALIVGGLGGYLWGNHRATVELAALNELATFQFIASESGANIEQYFIASPEIGTYALRRNIKLLESFRGQESFRVDEKVLAWDITLSYARLAKLADKLGKKVEASEAYSHALQASVQTGRRFESVRDLLLLVDKLDSQYREEKAKQ